MTELSGKHATAPFRLHQPYGAILLQTLRVIATMFFEAPKPKQYPKTISGLRAFATDWLNTPHTEERIVPAWPLDLFCGLILLSPPLLVNLFG